MNYNIIEKILKKGEGCLDSVDRVVNVSGIDVSRVKEGSFSIVVFVDEENCWWRLFIKNEYVVEFFNEFGKIKDYSYIFIK